MVSSACALLERLAMALRNVGRWQDALGTMNDALDRYENLGKSRPSVDWVGPWCISSCGLPGSSKEWTLGDGRWRHSATASAPIKLACYQRWRLLSA